ncbi:Peroxisome biogenesis 5 -like protein [Gossypium arboreum]|uniref:Peroxisome biogenesis 5-like protein n=1 Tax=Gossypium arboreum TaxID=29729 RepID=A0A0B0MCG7_GOSAR|nr:Peroxisome biogenesis 5 -like protein [Gossypium arboreum]
MRGGNIESLAAIQQTRMLAHTFSQNKFIISSICIQDESR